MTFAAAAAAADPAALNLGAVRRRKPSSGSNRRRRLSTPESMESTTTTKSTTGAESTPLELVSITVAVVSAIGSANQHRCGANEDRISGAEENRLLGLSPSSTTTTTTATTTTTTRNASLSLRSHSAPIASRRRSRPFDFADSADAATDFADEVIDSTDNAALNSPASADLSSSKLSHPLSPPRFLPRLRLSSTLFLPLFLLLLLPSSSASGYFELQILRVLNPNGRLSNGSCCDGGSPDAADATIPCPATDQCDSYAFVCLMEYQGGAAEAGGVAGRNRRCSFGNATTPVLGPNVFAFDGGEEVGRVRLPFQFAWTKSFTLIIEILDSNSDIKASDGLIQRVVHSETLVPGSNWETATYDGEVAKLGYKMRVMCDEFYYGPSCKRFCKPRDDVFGHYSCDHLGSKRCNSGWKGNDCEEAICRRGCHSDHGSCDKPGDCRCAFGWQGDLCDQCIPYPGCQHGSCAGSPWKCVCEENWGGLLCDEDLNPCKENPCLNRGHCKNLDQGKYQCLCQEGFAGTNCETPDKACASSPCFNGGTCLELDSDGRQFVCNCPPGFGGSHCQINHDDCLSQPCLNGGSCTDLVNGYHCTCAPQWEGRDCERDANECAGSPCVNARACTNVDGDYTCECEFGWTGKNCDINAKDCHGQCKNGATCVDLINSYHCICPSGFTGRECETNVNECSSSPCLNGGDCIDLIAGFECICPRGFDGDRCQTDVDLCDPNPCGAGARCFNVLHDFYCHCPDGFTGKDCRTRVTDCKTRACQLADVCHVPTVTPNGTLVSMATGICGRHGVCVSRGEGNFVCDCEVGFEGKRCEVNVNDCRGNPCKNGATCVDGVDSFYCICSTGWTGAVCTDNIDDCRRGAGPTPVSGLDSRRMAPTASAVSSASPCANNGTCVDYVADFMCECKGGWKGKRCHLREKHCDAETCNNGGTCVEQDASFVCLCARGFKGNTCQLRSDSACPDRACANGGTCVPSGDDAYTCMCKEGWAGKDCSTNVDDCTPNQCYNGGRCKDFVNHFSCDCAPGFAGPDCRINLNECSTRPCASGSTCVDGIAGFRCLCPPGRSGTRCQIASAVAFGRATLPCAHAGRIYVDGTRWQHECNECACEAGKVACTKIWCGPQTCIRHPNVTEPVVQCRSPNRHCAASAVDAGCFRPPCLPWGQCRKMPDLEWSGGGKRDREIPSSARQPLIGSHCLPNSAVLSPNCARITLLFDKGRLPRGVTVFGICNALRYLKELRPYAENRDLVILCQAKVATVESVEVTVSTPGDAPTPDVKSAANKMAEMISRRRSNATALAAILEVKVETTVEALQSSRPAYLIPLLCSLMGVIGAAAVAILVFWHFRRGRYLATPTQKRRRPSSLESLQNDLRSVASSGKGDSPNNQNEENLRRFRNPLPNPVYEMSDCSIVSPSRCGSLVSPSNCSSLSPTSFDASNVLRQSARKSLAFSPTTPAPNWPSTTTTTTPNFYVEVDEDIFEIEKIKGVSGGGVGGSGGAKASQSYPANLSGVTSPGSGFGGLHHYANIHHPELNSFRSKTKTKNVNVEIERNNLQVAAAAAAAAASAATAASAAAAEEKNSNSSPPRRDVLF